VIYIEKNNIFLVIRSIWRG